MKKPLTHHDIVKGQTYKVISVPEHLKGMQYPWIGKTGVALWANAEYNTVCVQFGGSQERVIPTQCLEEVEGQPMIIDCSNALQIEPGDNLRLMCERLGREAARKKEGNNVTEQTARISDLYRIVKVPPYWMRFESDKQYPSLGCIGKLIKIHHSYGTLRLSDGKQRFVPFDCMEIVTVRIPPLKETVYQINDVELIKTMVDKPLSTLKIIRGLAKMNKDFRLQAFLDRGVIL